MATEATMDMTGQEQSPAEVMVASNSRRSKVWGHFIHFRTGDGKSKARCKKCNRVLAAETRNGTSSLRRHVRACKGLGGSETDGHESRPHWSSDCRASGLETADVGAARPPQPMSPRTTWTWSLSLPGSSMHDQDEAVVQKMVSGFEQLCNVSTDKVQDIGAAPICSVQEAAAMSVGAAPPPQQQQMPPPPCALSRSGPADSGSSHSDHNPGQEEASEHFAPRPSALPVTKEPDLEVEEQAQHREGLDLEEDEASKDLARMIVLHGYDPSVVGDNHFRSFVRRLNPEFNLPSREALEKVCYDVYIKSRSLDCIKPPGGTSFGLGTRQFEAGKEVMYKTCHFIDHQWSLRRVVFDAYEIVPPGDECYPYPLLGPQAFTLETAAELIASDITSLSLKRKMPIMIAEEITTDFICIMKDFIQQNCGSAVNRKLISTTYMDHVLHSIARCLLPDSYADDILFVLHDIPLQKQEFELFLSQLGLEDPRHYNLHWYSCYCSLEILGQKIPDSELEPEHILLRSLWREIYGAIKRVTASTSPTSNLCLEELFKVRSAMQSRLSNPAPEYSDILRDALETVDKAIQESYLVWSIPLVLDPRYKLPYVRVQFQSAFGSDAANHCTSEIERNIKELYRNYIEEDGHEITNPSEQAWDENCPRKDYVGAQAEAELNWYLQDSLVRQTKDFDILNWWKVHGSAQYPTVARMARFALAMPTCSKLTSDQTALVKSIIRGYC